MATKGISKQGDGKQVKPASPINKKTTNKEFPYRQPFPKKIKK